MKKSNYSKASDDLYYTLYNELVIVPWSKIMGGKMFVDVTADLSNEVKATFDYEYMLSFFQLMGHINSHIMHDLDEGNQMDFDK